MPKLLVAIINYGFEANADRLKHDLSAHFPTVLIDSSSPRQPRTVDITIPNTYYPGLWNEAVKQAIDGEYDRLFVIASDVRIIALPPLIKALHQALEHDDIGVWTPSLHSKSRCEAKLAFNKKTDCLRGCGYIEGFCFLAQTSILKQQYPLPTWNKSGWGVDVVTSYLSKQQGLAVAVDDRAEIYHPRARNQHKIDRTSAFAEYTRYITDWGIDDEKLYKLFTADSHRVYMADTKSLDLGCGTRPHNPFEAKQLYGVDVRNVRNAEMTVKAADLTLEPIPYPASMFDYVTAFDFIEHVPRIVYAPKCRFAFVELMNEIWRVLKPGGILVSHTPAYPSPEAFQDPTHVNIITENTFPCYFSNDLWAKMYGFKGRFDVESQDWDGPHLHTVMRAVK
jgi:SAM-dependent methyltransferase